MTWTAADTALADPRFAYAALEARYGNSAPAEVAPANDVIALQLRHRSVRRFTTAPVDDETVATIVAAAQSAATSSNLQSWSVVEVRDPARKATASVLAGDQQFIRDAPVFLVFVADWSRNRVIAERRGQPTQGIDFIDTTLTGFVDAAIAAQNAVLAAESLGLGTVFVGSVRNSPEQLSDLLELPSGAFPVVGVALGHPDPGDTAGVKPRLPQTVVLHRERYRAPDSDAISDYDDTLGDYYETQGERRDWVSSVLRRVRDAASLHGRDRIRDALDRRGLPSR